MCLTFGFMGMDKLRPALTKSVAQVLRDGWAIKKKERKTESMKKKVRILLEGMRLQWLYYIDC